jgi:hypothetical protein
LDDDIVVVGVVVDKYLVVAAVLAAVIDNLTDFVVVEIVDIVDLGLEKVVVAFVMKTPAPFVDSNEAVVVDDDVVLLLMKQLQLLHLAVY